MRSTLLITALVSSSLIVACGSKDKPTDKKDAAVVVPQVAPITQPPSGVDAVKRMGFVYGDGWPAYDKAVAAKGKGDVAAARTQLEASIAKDPDHLDAHYLYAKLLAGAGEHAAAVDHLVIALAADYFRYGPMLAADLDMKDFLATPHGQAVTALAQKIQADYKKRVATGVWLVARRSPFKWPKDLGAQGATTRGELYAYDRETKRYLRLSHTDHKVAGFIRAPGGGLNVLQGCDGAELLWLLTAAFVVAPLPWLWRLGGWLAGLLLVWLLNVGRIASLFFAWRADPQWFDWLHNYIGPLLLIALLALYVHWVMQRAPQPDVDAQLGYK